MSESACYENRSSTLSSQVRSIVPFRFCWKLFKICHVLYLRSSHFLSQENEKNVFNIITYTKCFVKTVAFENKDFW